MSGRGASAARRRSVRASVRASRIVASIPDEAQATTRMKLQHKAPGRLSKTELLALFLTEGEKLALPEGVSVPARFLRDAAGDARRLLGTYAESGPATRVLCVGLGARGKVDAESFRRAAAQAVKAAEGAEAASATILVSDAQAKLGPGAAAVGRAVAEGAVMGAYQYGGGKSEPKAQKLKSVTVVGAGAPFRGGVEHGVVCAEANCFTRDLQNPPGNRMRPRDLAAAARKLAARSPRLRCRVLEERDMQRRAVLGGVDPPAAEHRGAGAFQAALAGERHQQREAALVDAVLRIVEEEAGAAYREALEAVRVGREQLAQVGVGDRCAVRGQRAPGGSVGQLCHVIPQIRGCACRAGFAWCARGA